MPGCVIILPKMVSKRLDLSFGIFARRGEKYSCYADKGYDSAENRQHLEEHRLLDGIMRKAHRNRPLTEAQTKRNRYLSKTRYVVEQSFGTLHRKFRYARAAYFWSAQSECAKPSEGDVFKPVESGQQAKCACCRLKGGPGMPDYQVSGED